MGGAGDVSSGDGSHGSEPGGNRHAAGAGGDYRAALCASDAVRADYVSVVFLATFGSFVAAAELRDCAGIWRVCQRGTDRAGAVLGGADSSADRQPDEHDRIQLRHSYLDGIHVAEGEVA